MDAARPASARDVRRVADLFVQALEARSLMQPSPLLELDLTMPQMKALVALRLRGAMRLNHLAQAIGATPTGLTGIVDRLAERGYVERRADPSDRRATVVGLLPAGDEVLREMYAAGREDLQRVLGAMPAGELAAVEQGMQALLRGIQSLLATSGGVGGDPHPPQKRATGT